MELALQTENKQLCARLRGELDHHAAGRLREEIDAALVNGEVKKLILDFSEVGFMDSSGIGLILGRYKRMQARGGTLLVCGASDRLRQVMQMAGLQKLHILEEEQA